MASPLLLALALLASTPGAWAFTSAPRLPPPPLSAPRGSELHRFDSLDLAAPAPLARSPSARKSPHPPAPSPVSLAAWWIPAAEPGPRPTLALLHGCSGLRSSDPATPHQVSDRYLALAAFARSAGYNALIIDSYGPRGVESTCSQRSLERSVTAEDRRKDISGALRWLSRQPGVDPNRVAVIGWSQGGASALAFASEAHASALNRPLSPKAAIAFYPGCSAYSGPRSTYRNDIPALVLTGDNDDWTPPEPCAKLAARLRSQGAPFRLSLFPASHHGFDSIRIASRHREDAADAESSAGATVAGNPAAREQAYREIKAFLSDRLR